MLPGCAAMTPVTASAGTASPFPSVPPASERTMSPKPSPETTATPAPAPTSAPTSAPAAVEPTKEPAATDEAGSGHSQAIVVIATGHTAKVTLYEQTGGVWEKLVDTKGCVGKNGITADKREGDKKTPSGVFALSFAFGTEKPDTGLDFRQITNDSYWVDDADSEYYNTWQEGYKGWKSAEKLSEYARYYHYAVATDFNAKCEPGRGSAIFLHCKLKAYTSGCVAVPESALLAMLKRLDPAKKPVIIIASSKKDAEKHGIIDIP